MGDWFPDANGYTAFNNKRRTEWKKERKGKAGRKKKHVQHNNHTRIIPWSTILLDNPRVLRLVTKFPTLYANWRFLTCSIEPTLCPYPSQSIWSIPNPYSLRPILILSCSLCWSISSGIFHLKFPCQNLHLRIWHPVAHLVPKTHNKCNYCFSEHSYVFIEI